MSPTLHRWIAASRAGLDARTAVFAFAALGHCAFLATVFGQCAHVWVSCALATPNLLVLAAVTFGRPRVDGLPLGPTGTVVAVTAAAGVACGLLDGSRSWLPLAIIDGIGGAFAGLLGATVATPLCLAVSRWRLHPMPRRALDVWATLACIAAVFAVVRPDSFAVSNSLHAGEVPPLRPMLRGALLTIDRSLNVLALLIAAAVFALDLALRQTISRAREGVIEGRRSPLRGEAAAGDALSLATMHDEEMVGVMGAPGEASYRDFAAEPVLVALPKAPRVSWRLIAMPVVALVCALGIAFRW